MFSSKVKYEELPQFDVFSEDGKCASPVIKAVPDVDFAVNAFGWPLNDISALNGCKSLQEFNLISTRLAQYTANNPDTSKLSTAELISAIEPQSFQTPAEVAQFAEYYGRHCQRLYDQAVEKKAAADAAAKAAVAPASKADVILSPEL